MPLVDQNTMTESATDHRCSHYGITVRDLLQFVSSLLLPLMLGVFTIVITIQQQRVATEQRRQDLNDSAQQRAQDKLIAREQREEDERRRLQDLKIAEEKRNQDDALAEKERDMLEKQRAHELAVEAVRYEKETQKYLDGLLVTYMNEVGTLFVNNNGSLTTNPHIGTLVRAKTLTIARQLDPSRNTHLIHFLYEAGQLSTGQQPLDLSGAHFDGIDLSTMIQHLQMHGLSLSGAHLNNASFNRLDLTNADFSNAHLTRASFVGTYLEYVNFSHAILLTSDFQQSSISWTNFDDANMVSVKFSRSSIEYSSFTNTNMAHIRIEDETEIKRCNFTNIHVVTRPNFSQLLLSFSILKNVDFRQSIFTGARIKQTEFIAANLDGSNFSLSDCAGTHFKYTPLRNITFVGANLQHTVWAGDELINIDFTGANLIGADFDGAAILENVIFTKVKAEKMTLATVMIKNSTFSYCECSKVSFVKAKMSHVSFENATLHYANFSNSKMETKGTFYGIDGFEADFSRSDVRGCTFAQSRLINASFTWTDASRANFTNAEITGIDFSQALLQDAEITQGQLDLAMSISGARFQTKFHHNRNILMNSGYKCNTTAIVNSTFWQVKPSKSEVMMTSDANGETCSFTVSQPVIMSQEIDVLQYQHLIDKGRAKFCVKTNIWNTSTTFNVIARTYLWVYTNHSFQAPTRPGFQILQPVFLIPQGTRRLFLSVAFETATSRCSSINLSVQDIDTELI